MERHLTTRRLDEEPATERFGAAADPPVAVDRSATVPLATGREASLALGRYRAQRRLGAGGHGAVWLAWDEHLEREVALKIIPSDENGPGIERAEREARVAARMNHPGIVALFELGRDENAVYLVSELVRGATLAELLREGALSDRDLARIGIAMCEALAYAHASGVIHRDVKPANVMVVGEPPAGGGPAAGAGFAKLTDFGVAHLASGDPLTYTGDVVGTLAYMAPEQADGQRVGPAADVYALALTLYEGFSGENPVRARGAAATARRVGRPLPSLASRRRDLPRRLCAVIDAALDPDPGRRPGLAELNRALEEPVEELSDEGGLVEPGTLERFGLTPTPPGGRWREAGRPGRRYEERGRRPFGGNARPVPAAQVGRHRSVARLAPRLLAAAAAAGLLLLAFDRLSPNPETAPAVAGAVALAVLLLPRIGWLAGALAVTGWLAIEGDRAGTAAVLAATLGATAVLLPRAGVLWSLPALAPLLGAIGLAPLYLIAAGLATTVRRRAGRAAAGALWLAAAEAHSGEALLFGAPDGTLAASEWKRSVADAAEHAVLPLVTSPAPVTILAWAGLAVAAGPLVRRRALAVVLGGASLWAAGVVVVHGALGDLLDGYVPLATARGAVAGAVIGALVAVAAWALAPPRTPVADEVFP